MKKEKPTFKCLNCNKDIAYRHYSNLHKFCNHDCQGSYRAKVLLEKYKADFVQGKVSNRPRLKQILTEDRGYKCEVCNIDSWNGKKIVLQVDHIDGHSENNMPSNLRLICPNCHSQTDSFAGANRGKGRWSKEGWVKKSLTGD